MLKLLSEEHLNDPYVAPYFNILDTRATLNRVWFEFYELYDRSNGIISDSNYKSLGSILDKIQKNMKFTDFLMEYFSNKLPTEDYIKFGFKKEAEMKKLGDLIRNLDISNDSQTIAYHNLSIGEIYEKRFVLVSNFTLHTHFYQVPTYAATSTLYYDIILPFHNKNYDSTSKDCTSRSRLPYLL